MSSQRKQLAHILEAKLECSTIAPLEGNSAFCGAHDEDHTKNGVCGLAERIADAIIQAGWTPPPTPAHNTTTHN